MHINESKTGQQSASPPRRVRAHSAADEASPLLEPGRVDELAQSIAALTERVEAVAADVAYLMEENQALQMLLARLIDHVTLNGQGAPLPWEEAGSNGRGHAYNGDRKQSDAGTGRRSLRGSTVLAHRALEGRAVHIRPWIPSEFAATRVS